MNEKFRFGESDQLNKREQGLHEFLDRMFDEQDRPYFISDEACLYDIYSGDEMELIKRCEKWYGRQLIQRDFLMPIWQLLDTLQTKEN